MTFTSGAGLQPIEPIEGSPDEIRRIGKGLRYLTERLDVPRRAADSVQQVRHHTVWEGRGFDAFVELITLLPKPSDLDNAVDRITWLATRVETFAEVLHECQVEHDRCRDELDAALPASGVEVADELGATLSGIRLRAADVVDRLEEAAATLRDTFDEIDHETIYAEPPPSGWKRAANALDDLGRLTEELVIGIGEGTWTMVSGLAKLMIHLNPVMLPYTGHKLWQNRETIRQVVEFAREDPGQFTREMGKAVVDYETFHANPARWAGRLVPDLVLTMVTAGSGGVATKASTSTMKLLGRADEVAELGESMSKASNVAKRIRRLELADVGNLRMLSADDLRVGLHKGVYGIDAAMDPLLAKPGRLFFRPLNPRGITANLGFNAKPTTVKNLATGGLYSKAKLADHVVNGFPRMTRTQRGVYVGSRAMRRGDSLTNLDDYESYFDTAVGDFEAKAQDRGAMRAPGWVPERPAAPAARYQSTSAPPP